MALLKEKPVQWIDFAHGESSFLVVNPHFNSILILFVQSYSQYSSDKFDRRNHLVPVDKPKIRAHKPSLY